MAKPEERVHPDGDEHKGAVESESPYDQIQQPNQHDSLADQLPHRNHDELMDDNDSDFPEPGSSPEHSGEHS